MGFLRFKDGMITTFDLPAHGNTLPVGISNTGQIIGRYWEGAGSFNTPIHGFLRKKDGKMVSFDGPDGGHNESFKTSPVAINAKGQIVGGYSAIDGSNSHSFLRERNGVMTPLDLPGPPLGIDQQGQIFGSTFLRQTDGTIVPIDIPGAQVLGVNAKGQLFGTLSDVKGNHVFLWTP
jgi:probable HAF family extracellular repeat protein